MGITQLDQYLLLLEVLAAEEKGREAFNDACKMIDTLLETRKVQMSEPRLMFNLFDPMRNSAARNSRIAKVCSYCPETYLIPYLLTISIAVPAN